MRKARLNLYERVAGMFVLSAIVGAGAFALSSAVKQGWFEPRISYTTIFSSAEGVHPGTSVKMSGLTVGAVESVDLLPDNRVRLSFNVMKKFSNRLREDSMASLIRPFIIGDRVLEVTVGSDEVPALASNAELRSEENMDLMSLMSGRRTNHVMTQLSGLMNNLAIIIEAFSDKERTTSFVRMFDRMDPLLGKMTVLSDEVIKMSKQVNKDESLSTVMRQAAILTTELNRILPELNNGNPQLGSDLAKLTKSLGRVTEEMDRVMTQGEQSGTSPAARMMEALNETTILIKALQKSILVRGSVREVRDEEQKRRQPAEAGPTK